MEMDSRDVLEKQGMARGRAVQREAIRFSPGTHNQSMTETEILNLISRRLQEVAASKGLMQVEITSETLILGGTLPLDSLDLAGIVVELATATGYDPFRDGLINFRTVGQLARLYAGAA